MQDVEKNEREAVIPAKLYDQDGVLQPFHMTASVENQHFAEWLRVHDRYTPQSSERKHQ